MRHIRQPDVPLNSSSTLPPRARIAGTSSRAALPCHMTLIPKNPNVDLRQASRVTLPSRRAVRVDEYLWNTVPAFLDPERPPPHPGRRRAVRESRQKVAVAAMEPAFDSAGRSITAAC